MSRPRKVTADDVARVIVARLADDLPIDAISVAVELDVHRSNLHQALVDEVGLSFSEFRRRIGTYRDVVAFPIDDDGPRSIHTGLDLSAGTHRWLVRRAAMRRVPVGTVVDELVAMARSMGDTHGEAA